LAGAPRLGERSSGRRAAGYPDYALAGAFRGAHHNAIGLLETGDPVHGWRERMLDLFDGLGRKAPTA
jgi:glutathione S-transferase